MFVHDARWYPYHLPFRRNFTTAHGTERVRDGAIVEILTSDGIVGVGEIAPLPSEFGGGTLADALAELPMLADEGRGLSLSDALSFIEACSLERAACTLHAPTLCGLEMALLDAFGKANGLSTSCLLSPPCGTNRREVKVNAVISARDLDEAWMEARQVAAQGFTCVKLKVATQQSTQREIERIAAVRDALGPERHLRLDANGGWTLEQARAILCECADYDIQYVEQPVSDLAGMRQLRKIVSVAIAADELVQDSASARLVLATGAADVLVLKPQSVGGLRACRRIISEARSSGVRCVISTAVESGIGIAAALHLAAATPEIKLECGLATLDLLVDDLIVSDLTIRDGSMLVPEGPGLGIVLDRDALQNYSPTALSR